MSYGEVSRQRSGSFYRIGLGHFDALEDCGFIQIEPVALESECRGLQCGVCVVEEVIAVDRHGFGAALVESNYSKVCACFDIGVFEFPVNDVDSVVMKCPSVVYVLPYCGDRACSPRAATARVCPLSSVF